jgi:hypothetical protein
VSSLPSTDGPLRVQQTRGTRKSSSRRRAHGSRSIRVCRRPLVQRPEDPAPRIVRVSKRTKRHHLCSRFYVNTRTPCLARSLNKHCRDDQPLVFAGLAANPHKATRCLLPLRLFRNHRRIPLGRRREEILRGNPRFALPPDSFPLSFPTLTLLFALCAFSPFLPLPTDPDSGD